MFCRKAEMIAFASAWTERQSSYLSPEGILSVSRVQVPRSEQLRLPRGAPL